MSAKKSYDEVLAHRKEMIEPLEKAEKIVKTKVNEYSAEQERKRREQEEAMRRLAQAEIDRHLKLPKPRLTVTLLAQSTLWPKPR